MKKASKHDSDKVRFELLDSYALEEIAKVFTFGARKYSDHNWRGGLKYSRLFGALMRHCWAWFRGEDKDFETGISHLAHAGCCIIMLLWTEKHKKSLDDRFKGL